MATWNTCHQHLVAWAFPILDSQLLVKFHVNQGEFGNITRLLGYFVSYEESIHAIYEIFEKSLKDASLKVLPNVFDPSVSELLLNLFLEHVLLFV